MKAFRITLQHLLFKTRLGAAACLTVACVSTGALGQTQSLRPIDWDERSVFAFIAAELLAQDGAVGQASEMLFTEAMRLQNVDLLKRVVYWSAQSNQTKLALDAALAWEKIAPTDLAAQQAVDYMLAVTQRYSDIGQRVALRTQPLTEKQALDFLRLADRSQPAGIAAGLYKALSQALKISQSSPQTQWLLARLAAKTALKPQLLQHAKQAILTDRPVVEAIFALLTEEPEYVLQTVQAWSKRQPQAIEPLQVLGVSLAQLKRPAQAAQAFEQASQLNPKDITLLLDQADQLRNAEQASLARQVLFKAYALRSEVTNSNAALLLAEQLEDDYNHPQALEVYELALKLADKQPQVMQAVQERYWALKARLGDQPSLDALYELQKKPQSKGQDNRLLFIIAAVLREIGQAQKAVDLLLAVPASGDRDFELSMAYDALKQYDKSESLLRELLKKQAKSASTLNALGYGLVDRNASPADLAQGTSLLEQAYELAPDNAAIIDSIGWARFRLGQTQEALVLLKKAYALRRDPEVGAHLGEVLWSLGQVQAAKDIFKEVLGIDATHKVLINTLKRLQVTW